MSHFNYTLFPVDEKAKPAVGIKKDEAFDFIISKEQQQNQRNPNMYRNYLYGCHSKSYELYNNNYSITLNNDCNKELQEQLMTLVKELQAKRKRLNDALTSYPFGSYIDKSCARSSALLG